MNKILPFFFIIFCNWATYAQNLSINTNQDKQKEIKLLKTNYLHTSIRPINPNKTSFTELKYIPSKKKWLIRKLFDENFAIANHSNYYIAVNPLINYQKSFSVDKSEIAYQNTRGIEIKAIIGKKLILNSIFYENQANFPNYIDSYVKSHLVVPGQGATKIFEQNQHDYSQAEANFSFQASQNINISFGHGKTFIGSGYRSFLLSDFAFSYPYLKLQYEKKNWQYTAIWTEFNNFYYKYYAKHFRKNASIQTLSYAPFKSFTILFFQSTLWKTQIKEIGREYPWQLFLPIPGIQTFTYGLDNKHNVQIGINLEYRWAKYAKFYSQYLLDDEKNQKYAFQTGIFIPKVNASYFPKFTLSLRLELNYASENVYDIEDSLQSYTHYNEALAHPLGNNFIEKVINIQLEAYRIKLMFLYNQYTQNSNPMELYYTNIQFKKELNNVENFRLEIAYKFNKQTFLQAFAGYYIHKSNLSENANYYSLGLRTYISNRYYDF